MPPCLPGLNSSFIVFLPSEELLTFLASRYADNRFFGFLFAWEGLYFSLTFEGSFPSVQNSSLVQIFSQHCNYFSLLISYLRGFWGEVRCDFYFFSSISKIFFFSCSSIKILCLSFIFCNLKMTSLGVGTFHVTLVMKKPLLMQETWGLGSIPGSGRSPGGGRGNPLQYSCLENPMDRGAW